MHIAIVTFEGFNELDSLIALGILNRVSSGNVPARADASGWRDVSGWADASGWRVSIASPTPTVTSMNGVVLQAQASLEDALAADDVIIGSGIRTREVVADAALMRRLRFDPARQLLGAQCSGALVLAELGLLGDTPACTDLTTKPWVVEAGVEVLDQPFVASGNVATAGGCLASQYLAAWLIARLVGVEAAAAAIHYVAPVGEKDDYVARALRNIQPYLPGAPTFVDDAVRTG